ncbi:hypothetical protein [Hymenobacter sp.]|uniref:hypothetical protein n=1 Tax=Hymenobacter sp. TaxID=1898978 RepID=UPI00286B3E28|nr:hypothetical protein [Hymenobacter sp.]
MSDSAPDFYQQKTDAELQFFVDHPEYYQPGLIEAARRELRRRGVLPAPPAIPDAPILHAPTGPAAAEPKAGTLLLVAAVVLTLGGGFFYLSKQQSRPATASPAATETPKAPPQLTEVATSVIPNYDGLVVRCVQRQVQRIPAAERAAAAKATTPMHQYRELTKRFWAAETQTEYVTQQARLGNISAALPGHVEVVQATWGQWNKALVYGYKFGPAMANHLGLMTRVAQQQQEGLADLLLVARNPQPFENAKTIQRAADVNDLLSGLLPNSPVTGQPYQTIVRKIQL